LDDLKKNENKKARRKLRKLTKKGNSDPREIEKLKKMISQNKGDLKKKQNTQKYLKAKLEVKKRIQKNGERLTGSKSKF